MIIERKWAMPSPHTFTIPPIRELILSEIGEGVVIDPFCGESSISSGFDTEKILYISNDINPNLSADCHMDATEFLRRFNNNSIDLVLYDPPYSPRQVSECYKKFDMAVNMQTTQARYWSIHKKEISRIVRSGGKVITFSWNSGGIGKKYGFSIEKILLVPHGGWHNDTICTVEIKT